MDTSATEEKLMLRDVSPSIHDITDEKEPTINTSYPLPEHLALDEKAREETLQAIVSIDVKIAVSYLEEFLKSHRLDQHLAVDMTDDIGRLLDQYRQSYGKTMDEADEAKLKAYYYTFEFNSPYAEVRASVPNTDDLSLPVETFRAYFLGILFAGTCSAMNQFFALRWPSIAIGGVIIQLTSYPAGLALAKWLPTRTYKLKWFEFSFNPGPFNQKEHLLITILGSVAMQQIFATNIFVTQISPVFFNQSWARSLAYQYCITISMQCLGYGLAGLVRACIVYPDYCLWPGTLPTIVLNRSLHKSSGYPFKFLGLVFTRYRYFFGLAGVYFVWFILGPGYLFGDSLSNFNWITWFKPDSRLLVLITGGVNGLGLNPLPTLDWNRLSIDPFVTPFFTLVNYFMGMLLSGCCLYLPIFLRNIWNSGYLPFNMNRPYDRFGNPYNISAVLDERGNFVEAKYLAYSPLYLSAAWAAGLMMFFAWYTSTIVHSLLFHHSQMLEGIRNTFRPRRSNKQMTGIHYSLISKYPEAPQWWYGIVFFLSFVMAFAGLAIYVPEAPKWLLFFAVALSLGLIIPVGILTAITNNGVTLDCISGMVGGFVVPGHPLAVNMFIAYGTMTLSQAISFLSDLKLGHYAKIPPRAMFRAQILGTLLSVVTTLSVMDWQLNHISGLCTDDQKDKFTCNDAYTFFTNTLMLGMTGPARLIGPKAVYKVTVYGFLIGALIPIPFYILSRRRFPKLRHVYTPILFAGAIAWSPVNLSWVIPSLYIGYIFQIFIKRKYFDWWSSYNYLTSSALTCGSAIGAIVLFFSLQYYDINLKWWGTSMSSSVTLDGDGAGWLSVPPQGFGPSPGEFE